MAIDLNHLSDEVLFYSNDQFYNFIEECLGVDEMKLIKLQAIKNSRTLISVPDVLTILNFNCKEIVELKNRICFVDDDNADNFVVKSGIKTSINDLITALKEKNSKHTKRKKNLKSSSSSLQKLDDLQSSTSSSSTSSSSTSSCNSNEPQLTPAVSTAPQSMSTNDYIQLISDSIEKFSLNTFGNLILTNNNDYVICLNTLGAEITGFIKCGCNTTIKIGFRSKSNSFQLSAYLKHLKNSRCRLIKKKKQSLDKIYGISNNSSDIVSEEDDCPNIDGTNNCDEQHLNNENDSSQTTTNISNTSGSNPFGRKRSLPASLKSSTKKKIKSS